MTTENTDNEPKLRTLDLKTKQFEAAGKQYFILEKIPLSRYKMYQKLVPRVSYGMDFLSMFKNLKKSYEALNLPVPKPLDAGVIIHNIMKGITEFEDDSRTDSALLICSLIIAEEGEDLGTWDEKKAREKIDNWGKGGYDVDGFFQLAIISIQGFRGTFAEFIKKQAEA